MAKGDAALELEGDRLRLTGRWTIDTVAAVDARMAFYSRGAGRLTIDAGQIARLDTAGAWLIARTLRDARKAHRDVHLTPASPDFQPLLDAVIEAVPDEHPPAARPALLLRMLASLGDWSTARRRESLETLNFFGLLLITLIRVAKDPRRLRFTATVYHMKAAGLDAVPIVSLMAFLLGIVIAYQGAMQLQRYGAEVFTVNLTALSILREIGMLLTAILVAGRSGSAFTAAIGSMKLGEEIDALRAMGLDPIEFLAVPRTLALLITLPILGFIADLVGLFGGGVMCWVSLGISPTMYLARIQDGIAVSHFVVGIVKAPFFALAIATIGCHQGFQVQSSAESVGRLTTMSVVQSIFLMILLDAAFSVFFSAINY